MQNPSQVQVTDDMKSVNVTKFITGQEDANILVYFQQQMELLLKMGKYQPQQGNVVPNWKDIVRPWFVQESVAALFLEKKEVKEPFHLFELLRVRNAPKKVEYSTAALEVLQELVKYQSMDKHQLSIQKFAQDFVARSGPSLLALVLSLIDLSQTQFVANNKDHENFIPALEMITTEMKAQLVRKFQLVEEGLVDKVEAELGMAIIACDPSLFNNFENKKPNQCTLPEMVEVIQTRVLDADPSILRKERLIRLNLGKPGSNHVSTLAEIEKQEKKRGEKFKPHLTPQTVPPQQPIPNNNNNNQPPTFGFYGAATGAPPARGGGATRGGPGNRGGAARGGATPIIQSPLEAIQQGRAVAVPCRLCLANTDPLKAARASFHLYEQCFDHPTLGVQNKANKPVKGKKGGAGGAGSKK